MLFEVLEQLPKDIQLPLIKAFTALREELADSVRREDFNELKHVVQELAEAQKRTEARLDSLATRVEELAEAQKRTEQRLEELAEAQKRTEARLDSLSARMLELAEAQKQTQDQIKQLVSVQERLERTVGELDLSLKDTRKMLAGLSDSVGYGLEDRAIKNLAPLLEQRHGFRLLAPLCRKYLPYMGGSEEVNIYGRAEREGKTVTLLGEAKTHLSVKHIDRFLTQVQRLQSLGAVTGEVFPFMISYSIKPDVEAYAREKSLILFHSFEV